MKNVTLIACLLSLSLAACAVAPDGTEEEPAATPTTPAPDAGTGQAADTLPLTTPTTPSTPSTGNDAGTATDTTPVTPPPVVTPPSGPTCDDKIVCTDDSCVDGVCKHEPNHNNCPGDDTYCMPQDPSRDSNGCVHLPCGELPDGDFGLGCVKPVCNMQTRQWETHSLCKMGETCNMGTCVPPAPAPVVKPVLTCALNGTSLTVTFTGPVDKGFSSSPPAANPTPSLFYGSNEDLGGRIGWNFPYSASQKPTVHWNAPGETQIVLSSQANAFNFVVMDGTGQHWFALDKWEIKGDCLLCDPASPGKNICRVGAQRIY